MEENNPLILIKITVMKRILFYSIIGLFAFQTNFAQWTNGADIPEGIRAGNTENHQMDGQSYVYIFGGRNDQDIISDKVHRYNLNSNSWDEMASVPTPILGASSAKVGEKVYIIGGMVTTPGTVTKKVYRYDLTLNSWDQVSDMPVAYTDGDAVAYQDSLIYTVGAYNSEKTYVYNTHTDEWRQGTSVPSPGNSLSYGALSVYGDKLVYVGGSNGTFSTTYWNNVWIGEIDQNDRSQINWTEGTAFPGETRTFFELKPWQNGLILIGGTTDNTFDTVSDENYFYDVTNGSWTALTPKPTAWNTGNATSMIVDGMWKLICTGGFNTEYLVDTEIYTIENMAVSDSNADLCHLKHFQTLGGKNPKLNFCTKENGEVGLFVWDGQGRLVREKSQIAENAGNHLIPLSDLNLSTGIYFVSLHQNGFRQTKKIQILK